MNNTLLIKITYSLVEAFSELLTVEIKSNEQFITAHYKTTVKDTEGISVNNRYVTPPNQWKQDIKKELLLKSLNDPIDPFGESKLGMSIEALKTDYAVKVQNSSDNRKWLVTMEKGDDQYRCNLIVNDIRLTNYIGQSPNEAFQRALNSTIPKLSNEVLQELRAIMEMGIF